MSQDNPTSTRLRDGTSRQDRLLPALDTAYFRPDEQSTEALLRFAQAYARQLQYFDENNEAAGDWSAFLAGDPAEMAHYLDDPTAFDHDPIKKERFSRPHFALLLCFLGLLRHAQGELNTLTQRHLDYYFRDVLRLGAKPALPDQVHLIFSLDKDTAQFLLPAGTALSAGDDAEGKPLVYATDQDIVLNQAQVAQIKNLHLDPVSGMFLLYADTTPQPDSSKNAAPELKRWQTFGSARTGQEAALGFVIASPLLLLREGKRTVEIKMTFPAGEPPKWLYDYCQENQLDKRGLPFRLYVSTATGMCLLSAVTFTRPNEGRDVSINLTLGADFQAIAPLETPADGLPFLPWPMIQLVWNAGDPFRFAQALHLTELHLTVTAKGLTQLLLQNDEGELDSSKPFEPFGTTPLVGSALRLTHPELMVKPPDSVTLHLDWSGSLDVENTYYKSYNEVDKDVDLTLVGKAQIKLIEPGGDEVLNLPEGPLFTLKGASDPTKPIYTTKPAFSELPPEMAPEVVFTRSRHLRIPLSGLGFLHERYPFLVDKLATLAAAESPTMTAKVTDGKTEYTVSGLAKSKLTLPPPYVPKLKSLTLDYQASASFSLAAGSRAVQFFYLHPFGYTGPAEPDANGLPLATPGYQHDGELYLGLENLRPPQTLSVLFQLAEGSANPEAPEARVTWSYLSQNQWITPGETEHSVPLVLSDDTNGLLQSGMIRFDVPADADAVSTVMPPGLCWLRAVAGPRHPAALKKISFGGKYAPADLLTSAASVSDLLAVQAQALRATLQHPTNAGAQVGPALPPGSITGLVEPWAEIEQVIQPYTSFGGRPREADSAFYTRVSERLRHKNRALSLWDYERLVLENFPEIYKVKCLPADDLPGKVTLVVIPDIRKKHPFDPFEPKAPVGVLQRIRTFLLAHAPPFADIEVHNPLYETVRLDFDVKFRPGYDAGYYAGILQEALVRHLSPWAYDVGAEIAFDQTIYAGAVAYFMEQQPYVDFLASLNLYQLDVNGQVMPAKDSTRQVLASDNPRSIWVSARQHYVRVLETEEPDYGIGAMRIEYDFHLV